MSLQPAHRLAVYWAPLPSHPLWKAGCAWLGRDAASALHASQAPREHTQSPRRYGFHATLKAPFALRDGATPQGFLQALRELAATMRPFDMPALDLRFHGDFLALVPWLPLTAEHPLRQLADRCVRQLDVWRAPLTDAQIASREKNGPLPPEKREALLLWGYPLVFEHWRFHMTLTDSLPADALALRQRLQSEAQAHFAAALRAPLRCESVALFVEPTDGAPFVLAEHCPFAA
jgi:hypothetical protein